MDGSVVNNHGDHTAPRVAGPLPNGHEHGLYKWGVILTTYDTWDDPPSIPRKLDKHIKTWQ